MSDRQMRPAYATGMCTPLVHVRTDVRTYGEATQLSSRVQLGDAGTKANPDLAEVGVR